MEPGQRALILSGTTDDINEARAGEGSSNKWLRLEFLSTVMAHFGRETQASYGEDYIRKIGKHGKSLWTPTVGG